MAGTLSDLHPWERRAIQGIDMAVIQKFLVPLYILFILLNFVDAFTTLLAVTNGPFVELNHFASPLFAMRLQGFALAVFLKYVPAIPLFFMLFVGDKTGKHDVEVRLLRFTALVVLIGADAYVGLIVLGNNLPLLINSFVLR